MKKLQTLLLLSICVMVISCAKNTPFDVDKDWPSEPDTYTNGVVEVHIEYGENAEKFNLLTNFNVINANGTLPEDFHVLGIKTEPEIDHPFAKNYYIHDSPITQKEVTYTTSAPVSEAGLLFLPSTENPDITEFDITVTFKIDGKVVDAPRVLTLSTDIVNNPGQGLVVDTARPGQLLEAGD